MEGIYEWKGGRRKGEGVPLLFTFYINHCSLVTDNGGDDTKLARETSMAALAEWLDQLTETHARYMQWSRKLPKGLFDETVSCNEQICTFFGYTCLALTVSLSAVLFHAAGALTLLYYIFDQWCSSLYWFVFGFCCVPPALIELCAWIFTWLIKKQA